jgi:hypothetical protein
MSGIGPESHAKFIPLRKNERADPTEGPTLAALYFAQDWKLIEMWTGTVPDCRPSYVDSSPTFRWSVKTVKPSEVKY